MQRLSQAQLIHPSKPAQRAGAQPGCTRKLTFTLGKGMPTSSTARALPSVKSRPSEICKMHQNILEAACRAATQGRAMSECINAA